MAIWHTRMLGLTPYPAAAMLYKGSLPSARPLPRRWEAGWTIRSQRLGQYLASGREGRCFATQVTPKRVDKGTSWKARPVPRQPRNDDRGAVLKRCAGVGCRRPARNSS
jgi:hypothetical protein